MIGVPQGRLIGPFLIAINSDCWSSVVIITLLWRVERKKGSWTSRRRQLKEQMFDFPMTRRKQTPTYNILSGGHTDADVLCTQHSQGSTELVYGMDTNICKAQINPRPWGDANQTRESKWKQKSLWIQPSQTEPYRALIEGLHISAWAWTPLRLSSPCTMGLIFN